jgi:hypothetical protein
LCSCRTQGTLRRLFSSDPAHGESDNRDRIPGTKTLLGFFNSIGQTRTSDDLHAMSALISIPADSGRRAASVLVLMSVAALQAKFVRDQLFCVKNKRRASEL